MEKGVVDEAEGLAEQRKALALARVRLHEHQMEMVLQVSLVSSRRRCHRHYRRPTVLPLVLALVVLFLMWTLGSSYEIC